MVERMVESKVVNWEISMVVKLVALMELLSEKKGVEKMVDKKEFVREN